jgi:hypothetical protein
MTVSNLNLGLCLGCLTLYFRNLRRYPKSILKISSYCFIPRPFLVTFHYHLGLRWSQFLTSRNDFTVNADQQAGHPDARVTAVCKTMCSKMVDAKAKSLLVSRRLISCSA